MQAFFLPPVPKTGTESVVKAYYAFLPIDWRLFISICVSAFQTDYQLAFLTPGISPLCARTLKQIRQIPYLRR